MDDRSNPAAMTLTKEMIEQNEIDGYAKIDQYNPVIIRRIAEHYRSILRDIGENPDREGLLKTPERIAKALQFLTHGYDLDPAGILRSAMFREEYQQMVIVKDIEIYSLCEHHLLPFFGKAHVAYIPNGYIVGLSKIPRVVDAFVEEGVGATTGVDRHRGGAKGRGLHGSQVFEQERGARRHQVRAVD